MLAICACASPYEKKGSAVTKLTAKQTSRGIALSPEHVMAQLDPVDVAQMRPTVAGEHMETGAARAHLIGRTPNASKRDGSEIWTFECECGKQIQQKDKEIAGNAVGYFLPDLSG